MKNKARRILPILLVVLFILLFFCLKDIYQSLKKDTTEEQQRLIGELEDSISAEWLKLCEFYFREGLRAGLTNLKFLKEIEHIEYYL